MFGTSGTGLEIDVVMFADAKAEAAVRMSVKIEIGLLSRQVVIDVVVSFGRTLASATNSAASITDAHTPIRSQSPESFGGARLNVEPEYDCIRPLV